MENIQYLEASIMPKLNHKDHQLPDNKAQLLYSSPAQLYSEHK